MKLKHYSTKDIEVVDILIVIKGIDMPIHILLYIENCHSDVCKRMNHDDEE